MKKTIFYAQFVKMFFLGRVIKLFWDECCISMSGWLDGPLSLDALYSLGWFEGATLLLLLVHRGRSTGDV